MKNKQSIPENYDSALVNVTLSAKNINGKYSIVNLLKVSTGDWVMSEESAKKIKYLYPVRKNKILGVFEVIDYKMVNISGKLRVRFDLKVIYEGSYKLISIAENEINKTNYTVKYLQIKN